MGADLRLDHVVFLVRELDAALAEWTELGFTVVRGGAHEGSPTHNAIIALADGSYLELIARRPGAEGTPPGLAERLLRLEPDEGLADFALLSADLTATIAAGHRRGLNLRGPEAMGRTRPDGQQIAWELGFPPTPDLPFLIHDRTPRALRVPGGAATEHANGATGVAQLVIAVLDLDAAVARYRALLGLEPQPGEGRTPGGAASDVTIPHRHPQAAELQQMLQQLPTRMPEEERAKLIEQIRVRMEAGRSESLPWVGEIRREQSFTLGTTAISLVMSLVDNPWPYNRIPKHGEGPERLVLRSSTAPALQMLKHDPVFQYSIMLAPDDPSIMY
jgi:catechol 2,3-dioxygenase-like lactoylglutathione lyase family enzyme